MDDKTKQTLLDSLRIPKPLADNIRELAKEERRTIIAMVEIMYEQYMESINAHQK